MANQKHLDLIRQGVKAWNAWRQKHPTIQPDLRGANLLSVSLGGADLSAADLSAADLSGSDFYTQGVVVFSDKPKAITRYITDFSAAGGLMSVTAKRGERESIIFLTYRTDLSGAIFNKAKLNYTNLTLTNLSKASLRGTDLTGADLTSANLREADLSRAVASETKFNDLDLRLTKGLETIKHNGPSTIGVDTIYKSRGQIPESFLRKAGIPNSFLEVMAAITNRSIEYYSIFISYSNQDQDFADQLYSDLQSHGVRCWFAPHDMKIGDKIRARINEAIHLQDKLLLLLSEHALASAWVEDEVEAALEKEQIQQREVLFPIRLDESVMQTSAAWAAKLRRTRHIGDFTHWTDSQAYQQAFERLLRDLKAENNTKGEADGKPGAS